MADNPTINTDSIKAATTAANDLNDSIESGLKDVRKLNRSLASSSLEADRGLRRVLNTLNRMSKTVGPAIREFDKFPEIAKNAEEGIVRFAKGYDAAFYKGNKQAMIAYNVIAKNTFALGDLTRQIVNTEGRLSALSANFRDATHNIEEIEKKISELKTKHSSYNKTIKEGGVAGLAAREEQIKTSKEIENYKVRLKEAQGEADNLSKSAIALTETYREQRDQILATNKAILETAEAERAANREARMMAGGWTAVRAAGEGVMDSKIFDYFKKISSGALIAVGAKKIWDASNAIRDHARATSRIALSLGDATERGGYFTGGGRMGRSLMEASKEMRTLRDLEIRLGYASEDLAAAMNKVRAGIRMDREGRLSSEAIRNLTEEAAYFARVSGMELSDSVDLINTRIKRYGMTSKEAVANLQEMRTVIMQMTAGNRQNTLAMGDMVNIIEEASAASQSYIVDTRIMTGALRAAVNQAENLGVAQKQAKDVAEGVGKILSGAPDYIKIPAGYDLVNQLMGGDADKMLRKLDTGTRKQVKNIQAALKAGTLDPYVASKALMDLMGQSEAGIEAQSKHLEQTLLASGSVAAEHIAQQYGIENRATAFLITEMMQDASKMRTQINSEIDDARKQLEHRENLTAAQIKHYEEIANREKMTFATLMVKDAGMMNAAIAKSLKADEEAVYELMQKEQISRKEAENKILTAANKDLEMKGLSKDQLKEYQDLYLEGEKKKEAITAQIEAKKKDGAIKNATEIARLESEFKKVATNETIKQTEKLHSMMRPVDDIISKLERSYAKEGKKIPLDVKGNVVLDHDALVAAGIKSGEDLAQKLGIVYDDVNSDTQDTLDRIAEVGEKSPDEIKKLRAGTLEGFKEQQKAADSTENGIVGPIEKLIQLYQEFYNWIGGSSAIGAVLTGIGSIGLGIWALYRGQKSNATLVTTMMEGPIYRNVFRAIKASGGLGGGGGDFTRRLGGGRGGKLGGFSGVRTAPKIPKGTDFSKLKFSPVGGPDLHKFDVKSKGFMGVGDKAWNVTKSLSSKALDSSKNVLSSVKEMGKNVLVQKATGENLAKATSKTMEGFSKTGSTLVKAGGGLVKAGGTIAKAGGGLMSSVGGLAKKIPVAGHLIGAGFAAKEVYDAYEAGAEGKDLAKVSGGAVGGVVGGVGGGWAGAAAGGAAGAMIGSVVPVLGTAVGGIVGSIIGGLGGGALFSWLGSEAGEAVAGGIADAVSDEGSMVAKLPAGALPLEQKLDVTKLAESGAGVLPGTTAPLPPSAPPSPFSQTARMAAQARKASAGGATEDLYSNVSPGSLTPDGSLTLKVRGIYDIFGQYMKDTKAFA